MAAVVPHMANEITPGEGHDYVLPPTSRVLWSPEGVQVILLGTAHISYKSVTEAQEIVRHIQPRCLVVELCKKRKHMLDLPVNKAVPKQDVTLSEVKSTLQSTGAVGVMQLVLSSLTWAMADKIGLEITPGTEFAAAYREARQYGGKVFLGDRNIEITLKRAWRSLSLWEKFSLAWSLATENVDDLTSEELERMKQTDVISQIILELGEKFPGLLEPLIYERDRYIRYKLREYCRQMATYLQRPDVSPTERLNGGNIVVAIVGIGHMKGICDHWDEEIDVVDQEAISSIPPVPLIENVVYYGTLLCSIGTIGFLIYRRAKRL